MAYRCFSMSDNPTGPKLWTILFRAFKAVEAVDRRSIAETGIGGVSDFALLEVLLHRGPLPVNTIAGKVLLTSGSMTTAVDRAVKRGHVERRPGKSDGRVVEVHLTAAGRKVIKQAYANHARELERAFAILDRREREQLAGLLKKVGLFSQAHLQAS